MPQKILFLFLSPLQRPLFFFVESLEKGRKEYQMGASVEERVSLL